MSKSSPVLITGLALFWCVVLSSQQHLVCKNIEDVFPEEGLTETGPRSKRIQGPPGKTGPKGERGIRGLPGAAGGRVDYDRVDNVIDEKVTNSLSVMYSTIYELKRNLSSLLSEWEELKSTIAESKRKEQAAAATEEDCRRRGLLHSGKCFTIPHVSSSNDVTYDQAVAECAKHGALLAEIHNRAQKTDLLNFARTKMPSGQPYYQVWLGMEYKHSTSILLYRSGMEKHSNQFQWYPGHPSSYSSYKYLAMTVRNDGTSNFGIFDCPKSYPRHGAMCEKEI